MTFSTTQWTTPELDEAILELLDGEFPNTRMLACARALEYCRRTTPRGTTDSLLVAMRSSLRWGAETSGPICFATG